MKQQSFIICFLASLAFGCEVSHPIDPEIVECKIAGGTWQNSKCLCPPDIAASTNQTVCRDGKIYTCSNGLLNLVTQCPGECSDNGKLCNLETGGDGDVCYSDKDEQTSLGYLYSCEDGKCELKTICPLGCNDEVGHENECKKCEDKSVMCQDEYLKTCINGYWDSGVKCLNGCDKEQKICSSKEGYSSEKTKCDGDYLETYYVYQNDQLELKERKYCDNGCSVNNEVAECISCVPNELDCDEKVLKICNENNVWVDKEICPWKCTDGACTCETNQTKCENDTLYICNDGYQTQISCPWGCDSDGKCNCDENDNKCNGNILSTCENGNVIETYCARGCDETGKSCKQASDNSEPSSTSNNHDVVCSDGELTCIDMELKICEQGQWQLKEKCNDDSGTDMGFCYTDQCIKCEEIIGVDCIENMQSQIMCDTSEGKIPTRIDCAFGCTSNNNGYCEPCSESMPKKCESNKEYQCFNGMWQYTKTCALGCNETTGSCKSSNNNNSNNFNCNSILTDGSFTYLEVTEALFRMFGDIEQYANLLKKLNESIISEFSDKFDLSCNGKWLVFEFENKLDSSKMKYLVINFFNEDRSNPSEPENCEEDSNLYTILDSTEIPLMYAEYSSCDFNKVLLKLFADESYLLSSIQSCTEAKLSVPERTIMNCGSPITYLEQLDIKKKCDNDNSLNFEVSLSGSSESGSICR